MEERSTTRLPLEPSGALVAALAGAALLIAAWFLPAMHKLGGGSFSSLDYITEVQRAFKRRFFYAQLIALPVAIIARVALL
jgi:hypothetical protein